MAFKDKYIKDAHLKEVENPDLKILNRGPHDNVELLMRALPKESKQKLSEAMNRLIFDPVTKKREYEETFKTFMTTLAPSQIKSQIKKNEGLIENTIKEMFKAAPGEVPPLT